MTIDQFVQVVITNGLSVALVVFWAWKAADRESLSNQRIQRLEETVSGTLQTQLRESTAAIVRSTEAIGRVEQVIEKVLSEMTRPSSPPSTNGKHE
jgi:hypothetical protein